MNIVVIAIDRIKNFFKIFILVVCLVFIRLKSLWLSLTLRIMFLKIDEKKIMEM